VLGSHAEGTFHFLSSFVYHSLRVLALIDIDDDDIGLVFRSAKSTASPSQHTRHLSWHLERKRKGEKEIGNWAHSSSVANCDLSICADMKWFLRASIRCRRTSSDTFTVKKYATTLSPECSAHGEKRNLKNTV
jgi:hypothetical protein